MKKNREDMQNKTTTASASSSSEEDEALAVRCKENEAVFSSFLDLVPPKIYLNQEDHSNWLKLATTTNDSKKKKPVPTEKPPPPTKKSANGSVQANGNDDSSGPESDEEGDEIHLAHSGSKINKFDPRVFKTVSQILEDFATLQKGEPKTSRPVNKPLPQPVNTEKNTSIKVFNKSQNKSAKQQQAEKLTAEVAATNGDDSDKKSGAQKRPSKFKEQKNAALKRKRQRYDSQTEPQIIDIDHSEANSIETRKPVLNKNGQVVFSKFDFTADKTLHTKKNKDDKVTPTSAKPKDYKKLLKKLQEKREKVEQLKQTEPEKAIELELKDKWKTAIDKAAGIKVKDDLGLLKKSVKKIEKKKAKSKKNWDERVKSVEVKQQQAQEKRKKNLDKRKNKNKEKKMARLRKKGRILPGF